MHKLRLIAAFNLVSISLCLNGCTPNKTIKAQFTFLKGQGGEVVFTNQTANAAIMMWNYGDDSPVDISSPVTHTFKTNGTFKVTLTVTGKNGVSATVSQTIVVANAIVGSFTFNGKQFAGATFITHDTWQASNFDVFINDYSVGATYLRINNMPPSSNGSFVVNNGHDVNKAGYLNVDLAINGGSNFYSSLSGSLTKTGANSFTLSCTVIQRGSSIQHSVTATGTYKLM